jgi:thiamine pyrophosphokinase
MPRLILFANGMVPDIERLRLLIRPGDILYAADGGTRHVLALGRLPSVVIGDLDSLTQDELQKLIQQSVEIRQYPRDKNETDLELAVRSAVEAGYGEIRIVGGLGGRLDQTLANLALLTAPELFGLDIRMDDGVEEILFTRGRCELYGETGDIVSLLPWGGTVSGIRTEGLRWSLRDEILLPDRTRGISNEMTGDKALIEIESGLLLCIHRRSKNI